MKNRLAIICLKDDDGQQKILTEVGQLADEKMQRIKGKGKTDPVQKVRYDLRNSSTEISGLLTGLSGVVENQQCIYNGEYPEPVFSKE